MREDPANTPAGVTSSPSSPSTQLALNQQSAAVAPVPQSVSAAENPLPRTPDSPAEAQGRRALSTAFVRVGPDGHLTVELHDGRVLVLRNVVMRPKDYCGVQVFGPAKSSKFCGGYADVAGARPGGAPAPGEPDLAVSNPLKAPDSAAKPN